MKYVILLTLLFNIGCATKPVASPPSVSTAQVIESLTDTKETLKEAGEQNTVVAQKIDRALTLAESSQQANKNVVKPL
jgi:hypothetical protein